MSFACHSARPTLDRDPLMHEGFCEHRKALQNRAFP
jgi:hypothetical protein